MGNYKDLELDFIERTISLISQYDQLLIATDIPFEEQYNYTLLINCLLGLIVLPKQRTRSYIPKTLITSDLKKEMGLTNSIISSNINNLRDLVMQLRNSIAHFDLEILSYDKKFLVDEIIFRNTNDPEEGEIIVKFSAKELLGFLRYYSNCLISNLKKYRNNNPAN
mgnify:CR=1 FL=1